MDFRTLNNIDYWSYTNDETDGRFHIFLENEKWILQDYKTTNEVQSEYSLNSLNEAKQKACDLANR